MKTLTILFNLGQLVFVAAMLLEKGMPSVDDGDLWIFFLLTIVPVMSIIALTRRFREGAAKSLLALYILRRRLEEERRIAELKG